MTIATKVGAGFACVLAIILALGLGAYLSTQRLVDDKRWVAHAQQVQQTLDHMLSLHKDAETGQRGYLLTGEAQYLEPYQAATGQIQHDIDAVKELTADNPAQQQDMQQVQALSDDRLARLRETIDLRQESGVEAAVAAVRSGRGKQSMDELRSVVGRMQVREQSLLDARNAAADADVRQTLQVLILWLPLSLVALAVLGLIVSQKVRFEEFRAPQAATRRRGWRAELLRYVFAVAVVAATSALRWWLIRAVGPLPTYITFYPAVLLVSTLAGGGPGILATILSALSADYFFIAPYGTLGLYAANDVTGMAIFLGTNLFLCLLAERLRRAMLVEAVAEQRELLAVTVSSIGDAVIVTDVQGRVTFLNAEAERLTGWTNAQAAAQPLPTVFRIINEYSRQSVENPVDKVLRLGQVVGLANHTILLTRDGREIPIDDSGAPIRGQDGSVRGVVLVFRDFTERKQAEEADRRLAAIVENSDDAILSKSLDGTILTWNAAAQRLLGYRAEEAIGKPITQLIPPELVQEEEQILHRLRQGQAVAHYETVRLAKGGRRIEVSVTVSPLKDVEGNVVGASKILHDIAQEKRAAEALRASEEKYRTLFESIDQGFCTIKVIFDEHEKPIDYQFLSVNPAFERQTGIENGAGRRMREIAPAHEEHWFQIYGQIALTGEVRRFENAAEQLHRYYDVLAWRIGDPAQRTVAILFNDITEHRQMQEQMRLQAAALEAAANGIAITDANGIILWVNPAFCELTGYERSEVIGQSPRILKSGEQDDAFYREMWAAIRQGKVWHGELVNRRKDGTLYVEEQTIAPLRDGLGAIIHFIAVKQDITARRTTQDALAAAKVSAEHAKSAAEEANKAKDHFLAVLSHELRNPLNPVLAAATMLRDESGLDVPARELVEMILRNAELEARLIDDLLDVTRIQRGKVELNRQPVELCMIIRHAVEVCKPDIEARNLEFGIDIGAGAPYIVDADPARLQQVFWNLLKNAVKFTPPGGCVGVRIRGADGHVIAEVNDSGAGIEPEVLPRIFNAFDQGERGTTRQFGGLGLGLTISKAMVEMHGGTIHAHSEGKGKGATFVVRLPVMSDQAAKRSDLGEGPPSSSPIPQLSPASSLRILLVEDHGDTAKVMKQLLMRQGHHVERAGDVATALRLAGEQGFDLMLSDLGLPDGSGVDLMRELRSRGSTLPGIALSGYGQEEDIRRSKEAGFALHLTKPVAPDSLAQAIATLAIPQSRARARAADAMQ